MKIDSESLPIYAFPGARVARLYNPCGCISGHVGSRNSRYCLFGYNDVFGPLCFLGDLEAGRFSQARMDMKAGAG